MGELSRFSITITRMSTAQYRRIIKGSWSNTNEQRRLDQQYQVEQSNLEETQDQDISQEE
jgi:hypothetical protein